MAKLKTHRKDGTRLPAGHKKSNLVQGAKALSTSIKRAAEAMGRGSRRVTIPAGKKYVIFSQDAAVYVREPGQPIPENLQLFIDSEIQKAVQRRQQQAECNFKMPSPEETLRRVLDEICCHTDKQQNEMVAKIMAALSGDRQKRIEATQKALDDAKKMHAETTACAEGFDLIKAGGYERLNFK